MFNRHTLVEFVRGPRDGAHAFFDFTDSIVDPAGLPIIWIQTDQFFHQYIAATPVTVGAEVLRLVHRKVVLRSRELREV